VSRDYCNLGNHVSRPGSAALRPSCVLRTGLVRPSHRSTSRHIRVVHPLWLPFCLPDLVKPEGRFHPLPQSRCQVLGIVDTCILRLGNNSYFYTHPVGADLRIQVMLALIPVRAPQSKMAQGALMEFRTAYELFESAASFGGRAVKMLVCIPSSFHSGIDERPLSPL
jgi:hypothetical protein